MVAASALVRAGSRDACCGGAALRGLEQLENVTVATLCNADQAIDVAAVIYRTGFDAWDAQVAAVAAGAACWSSPALMLRSGGGMPLALMNRCTSSRSPARRRTAKCPGCDLQSW